MKNLGPALATLAIVAIASADNNDDLLPYFPGPDGEQCRVDAVEAWEASPPDNDIARSVFSGAPGVTKEDLDAVMATELYQTARDHCQAEIDLYNRASGVVCLLERDAGYDLGYNDFWQGGPYYFDGEYDLATMFDYTANFTKIAFSLCLADCYLGSVQGGDSCDGIAAQGWMTHYGTISKEQYCAMKWGRLDMAYFSLRLCAAEAIGEPDASTGLSRADFVGHHQTEEVTNSICKYQYCEADVYESIAESVHHHVSSTSPASTGIEQEVRVGLRH